MFCQKCGAMLTDGALFCIKCGNRVPVIKNVEKKENNGDILTEAVKKFQGGNTDVFDTIYNESKKYVYYTILKSTGDKEVADDIMQETYLDVYRSLDQLQNAEAFKGWAAKIAQHKISRYYQKKNPELFSTEEEMDDTVGDLTEDDTSALPEDAMINKEVQRLISEIIDELPQNQKSAVISYYYNQMSIPEIAQSMNVPESTVKTYLFRGKKKIKDGVLEIEQKHGTKLYALPLAGLLGLLFTEEAKAAVVTTTASQVIGTLAAGSAAVSGIAAGSTVVTSGVAGSSAASVVSGTSAVSAASVASGTSAVSAVSGTSAVSTVSGSAAAGVTQISQAAAGSMVASSTSSMTGVASAISGTSASMGSMTAGSVSTAASTATSTVVSSASSSARTSTVASTTRQVIKEGAAAAGKQAGKKAVSSVTKVIISTVVSFSVGVCSMSYVMNNTEIRETIREIPVLGMVVDIGKPKNVFVGQWTDDSKEILTINDDHTFIITDKAGDVLTGTWISDDVTIKLDADMGPVGELAKVFGFSWKARYDADTDTITGQIGMLGMSGDDIVMTRMK